MLDLRERTRAQVSTPVTLWAVTVAVVLVADVLSTSATPDVVGVVATALLGAYLGWRQRRGVIFFAPLLSWVVAVGPVLVASLIHDGLVAGVVSAALMMSVGWFVVGAVEVVILAVAAGVVHALRHGSRRNEVVIISPGERERPQYGD